MDEGFELTKEDREIISASIKGLDDAGFEGFKKNMGILMKEKNKSYREAQAKIAADKMVNPKQIKEEIRTILHPASSKKMDITPEQAIAELQRRQAMGNQ